MSCKSLLFITPKKIYHPKSLIRYLYSSKNKPAICLETSHLALTDRCTLTCGGYVPINPSKSKMHLLHLTYQTSWLSLAYLKCAQNPYIGLQCGKIISLPPSSTTREYHTHYLLLAQKKIKIQNLKYGFLVNTYHVRTIVKPKSPSRTIVS